MTSWTQALYIFNVDTVTVQRSQSNHNKEGELQGDAVQQLRHWLQGQRQIRPRLQEAAQPARRVSDDGDLCCGSLPLFDSQRIKVFRDVARSTSRSPCAAVRCAAEEGVDERQMK